MICHAVPYSGGGAHVSMISASGDDQWVWPFLERLVKKGFRIWHDAVIRQIEVEYSRNWRTMQAGCGAHLIFLTAAATENHIFRERFTDAVESGRPFIVIRNIQKENLSPAMRLQVEKASEEYVIAMCPPEDLTDKMCSVEILKDFVGNPDLKIEVQSYPKGETFHQATQPVSSQRMSIPTDRTMAELGISSGLKPNIDESDQGKNGNTPQNNVLEETWKMEPVLPIIDNLDQTLSPYDVKLPVIASLTTGEMKKGMNGETTIGRSRKNLADLADVTFQDSCAFFSRKHFRILSVDGINMLLCIHPNGIEVNGETELRENEKVRFDGLTLVQIPSKSTRMMYPEKEISPSMIILAVDKAAEELWKMDTFAWLQSRETGEIRWFQNKFQIGRENPWRTGVLGSRWISRNHADLICEKGTYLFSDHSSNGSIIGDRIIHNESVEIHDGDLIRFEEKDKENPRSEEFEFHCVRFERSGT